MLNIAFIIGGDDIKHRYRVVEANARLLRFLNTDISINLVIDTTAAELGVDIKKFDRVYEAHVNENDNEISFIAKTLPLITGDHVLYLNENLFSFTSLHQSIARNLSSGVYISQNTLDFRGNVIDTASTWNAQQLMSKHAWPVVSTKCIFLNNDDKSKSFFKSLEQYSQAWQEIGANISDGAMQELTLDNLISFVCQTNDDECFKTNILNYRSFARRDFAKDNNWIYKDWTEWLDIWWVTRDTPHLRIENFRQQGLIYLTGNYIEKVESWLEKINP